MKNNSSKSENLMPNDKAERNYHNLPWYIIPTDNETMEEDDEAETSST